MARRKTLPNLVTADATLEVGLLELTTGTLTLSSPTTAGGGGGEAIARAVRPTQHATTNNLTDT